jgi:glucose-6-phosphate 1-dehydrogenase
MDMTWSKQFPGAYVGDAYERMFLNAAKGDGSLFVSEAELVEAWRIFTPLLHEIDEQKPEPVRRLEHLPVCVVGALALPSGTAI